MLVLGTLVDDGKDRVGTEVAHRTPRAWALRYALRLLFCLRSIAARRRIRLFHSVVTAIVTWGL